jgi:hypothetical protein
MAVLISSKVITPPESTDFEKNYCNRIHSPTENKNECRFDRTMTGYRPIDISVRVCNPSFNLIKNQ